MARQMVYLHQIHFPGDTNNLVLTDTVHTKFIAYMHEVSVQFIWHLEVGLNGLPVLHVAFYDNDRLAFKRYIKHYNLLKVECGLYTPLSANNVYDAF